MSLTAHRLEGCLVGRTVELWRLTHDEVGLSKFLALGFLDVFVDGRDLAEASVDNLGVGLVV